MQYLISSSSVSWSSSGLVVDSFIICWHFATHLSHMKLPEMPEISRPTDIPLSWQNEHKYSPLFLLPVLIGIVKPFYCLASGTRTSSTNPYSAACSAFSQKSLSESLAIRSYDWPVWSEIICLSLSCMRSVSRAWISISEACPWVPLNGSVSYTHLRDHET